MMAVQTPTRHALDVRKARELIDGHAPGAPYQDLGEPSWFATDRERRSYWAEHAVEIVSWARSHGFALPAAAFRYGLPEAAHTALWAWAG
jgi:hypothetical protein